jgi:hypothetical protein
MFYAPLVISSLLNSKRKTGGPLVHQHGSPSLFPSLNSLTIPLNKEKQKAELQNNSAFFQELQCPPKKPRIFKIL